MNTKATFFLLYFRQLPNFDRYEDAYEAAEKIWKEENGRRKYSNYASFRTILSRYQKKY